MHQATRLGKGTGGWFGIEGDGLYYIEDRDGEDC